MTDPVQPRPLTVEQGRQFVARARRFQIWERIGLAVSAAGILTFGASIVELRKINAVTMTGGPSQIPYLAYAGIFLFWGGFALLWYMRSRVLHIHRMLDVEQKRRDAEAVAAQIVAGTTGDAAGPTADMTIPADAGPTDREE